MKPLAAEMINSFIELMEKIVNNKNKVLDLGDDLVFYRGESHTIKMIGDYPGIYSSEIARKFGITRAVVHKTLLKLIKHDFVVKKPDEYDKKKIRLYLTEKGEMVHKLQNEFHNQYDKALFEYVENMPDTQLENVKDFLEHVNELMEHYM